MIMNASRVVHHIWLITRPISRSNVFLVRMRIHHTMIVFMPKSTCSLGVETNGEDCSMCMNDKFLLNSSCVKTFPGTHNGVHDPTLGDICVVIQYGILRTDNKIQI